MALESSFGTFYSQTMLRDVSSFIEKAMLTLGSLFRIPVGLCRLCMRIPLIVSTFSRIQNASEPWVYIGELGF